MVVSKRPSKKAAVKKFLEARNEAQRQYGDRKLLRWEELPDWMKDNMWILTGYRVPMYSYRKCIQSMLYFHNEWVNVMSHFIGAVIFVGFFFTTYKTVLKTQAAELNWIEFFVFYCFIWGSTICMLFSSLFHCFTCHSLSVAVSWNRCDYVGIVVMIVGSFYPSIYYGFYCRPGLQILYIAGMTVLGVITITVALLRRFRTPAFRWVRTLLFLSLGLSGLIPVSHALVLYGYSDLTRANSLDYMLFMGSMHVIGAFIYGWRVPERWWPGKFDNWGGSHQIFHLLVVGAALIHYQGVVRSVAWWHGGGGTCDI